MPRRKTPLITNNYYHVFNRSVAKVPIFTSERENLRAIQLLNYYSYTETQFPFSDFLKFSNTKKKEILEEQEKKGRKLARVLCYCLMPNHFHLLLKQTQDDGILFYIRNFQNSYAKYFNNKNKRQGALFQSQFKAVLIEDNNQLLHLNRYIHLNPYSSYIVKEKKAVLSYSWSSLPEYLKQVKGFSDQGLIMSQFESIASYSKFILNQADYQRSLEEIKHLMCE